MSPQNTGAQVDQDPGDLISFGNEHQGGFFVNCQGSVVRQCMASGSGNILLSRTQIIITCLMSENIVYTIYYVCSTE